MPSIIGESARSTQEVFVMNKVRYNGEQIMLGIFTVQSNPKPHSDDVFESMGERLGVFVLEMFLLI